MTIDLRRTPTAARLAAMLAETPNLCAVRTLADIGQELGVSRERVRQMLPQPKIDRRQMRRQNRTAECSRTLAAFVAAHPEAVLPPSRGGMTFKQIALETGISARRIPVIWAACEYPDRNLLTLEATLTPSEIRHHYYTTRPARRAYIRAYRERWNRLHPEQKKAMDRRAHAKWYAKKKARLLRESA